VLLADRGDDHDLLEPRMRSHLLETTVVISCVDGEG